MRNRTPNFASQMRKAFSSMVLNTGSSSPGELEMTRSTSSVAACCSQASLNWRCASASGRSRSVAFPAPSRPSRALAARRKRVEILRDARKPLNGLDFAFYSITSSARASSVGGTSRPSALAVLRLMINSNLVA